MIVKDKRVKKRWPLNENTTEMELSLRNLHLNTVCEEASCPNKGECFSKKRVTFLILGSVCTRSCRFCGVSKGRPHTIAVRGRPEAPDRSEPERICRAIEKLGLKDVVITSVTRDDLADGGALHFRETIEAIKALPPRTNSIGVGVEVLTPDFRGEVRQVETVLKGAPDIFSHNVETVPRLYPEIRPEADYSRSLRILEFSSSFPGIKIKSGLMLGLGEEQREVEEVLRDLKNSGCDIITIGQYLRPGQQEIAVREYISDEAFKHYEEVGKDLGFSEVHAGTFVRSSYKL